MNVEEIITYTADICGVSVEEMKSRCRKRDLVVARQLSAYIIKEKTKLSLTSIANALGLKDHSTVIHSLKTVNNLYGIDNFVTEKLDLLKIRFYWEFDVKSS